MAAEPWLLPEGIDELLPDQALRVERLRQTCLENFQRWGYSLVQPPLLEYLDSLLVGTGRDLELNTFKLVDQLNGRMMGLRADITPQVARIDAHRLGGDGINRLCYFGNVLRTHPAHLGGSRSPLQFGAELYGHSGVASDAEVVGLMLETTRRAGLSDVCVDLGHVGIFRTLARLCGLAAAQEHQLFDLLQRKAVPELQTYLTGMQGPAQWLQAIQDLTGLHGDATVIETARTVLPSAEFAAALDHLQGVITWIETYCPTVKLHIDLAELRGYSYHTGVVFAAFNINGGQEIARGGRYDDIGQAFGKARPATGFSGDLMLLSQLTEPQPSVSGGVLAPAGNQPQLLSKIRKLRDQGHRVVQALEHDLAVDAERFHCDQILHYVDGQWCLKECPHDI